MLTPGQLLPVRTGEEPSTLAPGQLLPVRTGEVENRLIQQHSPAGRSSQETQPSVPGRVPGTANHNKPWKRQVRGGWSGGCARDGFL